ncbi:MAG: vWA domain-containing protein [Anaerolineae bacterium]
MPPVPLQVDGDAPRQVPPTRTPGPDPNPPGGTPGSGPSGPQDPEPAGNEDLLREVGKFIKEFVDDPQITSDLDSGLLRLGLAAFGNRGRTILTLQTGEAGKRAGSSGNRLKGEGLSRIDLGLRQAESELIKRSNSVGADPDRKKVILVLSDGAFCARDLSRAHVGKDIEVVTVFFGRGGWKRRLDKVATEGRYAFSARELKQILNLYGQELAVSVPTRMEQLLLHDTLAPNMSVDDTSVTPPYSVHHGQRLEWWGVHPTLPLTATDWLWAHSVISPAIGTVDVSKLVTVSERMTLTYRITPQDAGSWPVSDEALAAWHESGGVDGLGVFPSVYIDVLAPTATPTNTPTNTPTATATATPTATNTRTPEARYFPIAIRSWPEATPTPDRCPPELQRVDIALVVDDSNSMSETTGGAQTKLQAAIAAAKTLAGLLQLKADGTSDQAAVIGFNENATVLAPLTGDRAAIDAALDRLPALQAQGTFIDRALQTAIDELNSPRRRPGSTRSLVLVTDGKNNGDTARVLQLADALRANIAVFTVGLGLETDIDAGLLRAIATTPDNFRHAPTTDQLLLIYQRSRGSSRARATGHEVA